MNARSHTKDHFRTLELSCAATDVEIRNAYYRLARVHHPDHNYGDHEAAVRFKEVQLAYEALSERTPVPQPQESQQFPFIVTDPPRGKVSARWLTAISAVAILAATLSALYHREMRVATLGFVEPSVSNQPLVAGTAAARSNESTNLKSSEHIDTGGSKNNSDYVNELADTKIYDNSNTAAKSIVQDSIRSPTSAKTAKKKTPEAKAAEAMAYNAFIERAVAGSTQLNQGLPIAIEPAGLTHSNLKSNSQKWRPQTTGRSISLDSSVDLAAVSPSEPLTRWQADIRRLDDFHADVNYPGSHGLRQKSDGKTRPLTYVDATAISSNSALSTQYNSTSLEWSRAGKPPQPLPLQTNMLAKGFNNDVDIHGATGQEISRPAGTLHGYSSNKFPSGDYRSVGKPYNRRQSSNSWSLDGGWKSSPGSLGHFHDDSLKKKLLRDWSMSDRHEFSGVQTASVRVPGARPTWAIDSTRPQFRNAGNLATQSSSKNTELAPAVNIEGAHLNLNASLSSKGPGIARWAHDRSAGKPYKRSVWSPSSSRLEVLENVLPPYSSKSVKSKRNRRGY